MITKEKLEKHLKKNEVTVYSRDNIPLHIAKEAYLQHSDVTTLTFDMDCKDLAHYCEWLALSVNPVAKN